MSGGVRVEGGAITLDGMRGETAFVDVDWLPSDDGDVPALVASSRALRATWSDATWPTTGDAEHDAAQVLAAFAHRLAHVAERLGQPGVVGDGAVAHALRALLGPPATEAAPALVVCSSRPWVVSAALASSPMLGCVVLAGEGPDPVELDLYPEVHVRGLRVLTVAPPTSTDRAEPPVDGIALLGRPTEVASGTPLADAPSSGWLHVVR